MDTSNSRRFTLLDGMIVVGAVALGLAATRASYGAGELQSLFPWFVSNFAWHWHYFEEVIFYLPFIAMPILVPMTLGVVALRLRKPRPKWRRLVRQPGMVAGLVLVLAWVVAAIYSVVNVVLTVDMGYHLEGGPLPTSWDLPRYLFPFTIAGSLLGGFGVVVAWITLALVGRWRPEPTWLDRLGRAFGIVWILMALLTWFVIRRG